MQRQYTNIAFISYKREDEKWAKWLQKKLEHYKLPAEIRKQNPDLEFAKNPRHVFKDTTDLSGGVLAKAIKEGLDSSKFLIVICSPRAAKSPWVCKEVQEFIDSGREEYIIPFIIDGEPYAKNPENECFPEALKALAGERELLGISINENGHDMASVKIVARLFELRFDTLWDRFQREKHKQKSRIIAFIVLFVSFLITTTTWMYLQRKETLKSNWKMQESLAIIASEKAKALIDEGNLYEAITLCMEVMPANLENPEIPYVWQAEAVLRDAFYRLCNANGEKIAEIEVKDSIGYRFRDAEIIPGQKYICLEDNNETAVVDIESGKLLYKLSGRFCRFSSDGTRLITQEQKDSTCQEYKISVHETISGEKICESNYYDMDVIGFTQDLRNIVCKQDDEFLTIYDANTARRKKKIRCYPLEIRIIGNDKVLVYNRKNMSWQIYDITKEKKIFEITPEEGRALGKTFIMDSLLMCITTLKNKEHNVFHYNPILNIYNYKTGVLRTKVIYPSNRISSHLRGAYDKSGFAVFYDGFVDRSLYSFDLNKNQFTRQIKDIDLKQFLFGSDMKLYFEENEGIYKLNIVNGNREICTLNDMYKSYKYLLRYPEQEEREGIFSLYLLNNENPLMDQFVYDDSVQSCGKYTLSYLWEKYGGEEKSIFPSKGSLFLIRDKNVSKIYNNDKEHAVCRLDSGNVNNVEFSNNGTFLYAFLENSIAKFSSTTGKILWESSNAKLTTGSWDGLISISENDQYAAALSEGKYICIFNVKTNKLVEKKRIDHLLPFNAFRDNICIDNTGKYIFIADSYRIFVLDVESEQIIQTFIYPPTDYEYGWTDGNLSYDNERHIIKYNKVGTSSFQFTYSFMPTSILVKEIQKRMHHRHLTEKERQKYHINK